MSFLTFYSMSSNPFERRVSVANHFESEDFKMVYNRMKYLVEVKGIGVFTGESGVGKTFVSRYLKEKLNTEKYRFIYISATNHMKVFDFYKAIGDRIFVDMDDCYQHSIFERIQEKLIEIYDSNKIQPVVVLDDAHKLNDNILKSLKIFYDFGMRDSNIVTLIMIGNNDLRIKLRRSSHESLKQRIINNYIFKGLDLNEIKEYVRSRLRIANASEEIFSDDAYAALQAISEGRIRKLDGLVMTSLMVGFNKKVLKIDSEVIYQTKEEMDI